MTDDKLARWLYETFSYRTAGRATAWERLDRGDRAWWEVKADEARCQLEDEES